VTDPIVPWSQRLAPVDVKLLLEMGAPPDAVGVDEPVDLDKLRAAGWTLTDDGGLHPPQQR
jgi:hypothetical protein